MWRWVRLGGGAAVLAVLVWRVGAGPFVDAIRLIDRWAIGLALAIGVVGTVSGAWRWSLVAAGLGVRLPLGHAVAACYRAQFLNATLPGGVIGDVHRAVRHGLDLGDVGLGVRAVALERFAGQAATIGLAVVALAILPSPVQARMPALAAGLVVVGAAVALILLTLRALKRDRPSLWRRVLRRVRADVREGLITSGAWSGVMLTSCVCLGCHLATFLVAARTAGATAPPLLLVPLTLVALLAMVVPLNIAGWGLREGAAAWVFAAAGLTAAQGVSTAVTYGVLVTVASLPGAAVLILRWLNREIGSGEARG